MQKSLIINPSFLNAKTSSISQLAMQEEWTEIQAAQKNPALFRSLYDRYYEPIFRFIHRRTADKSLTGDLTSEVFFKAMQKLPKYQFRGVPFSAWLYRIASNEVTQHYRNNQKNRVVSVETQTLPNLMVEMGDWETTTEKPLQELLIPCLNELKIKDLELIEMRFFEQRPFKEIADFLEITESSCKMRTYRVLERLKKIVLKKLASF
ncbi:MAG: sigma-70 family RNA polymerase sigma factor [Bacteroidota bacterium]